MLEGNQKITQEQEIRFRNYIEGCIPDLMDAYREDDKELCVSEYRDEIRDYAGDRLCDEFPNASHEERGRVADSIANYYCGEGN